VDDRNVYVDRAAPWTAIKTDKDRAAAVLRAAINLARLYAIVGSPIIPDTCARLRASLGVEIGEELLAARRRGRARLP